jgi:putative hemolysin
MHVYTLAMLYIELAIVIVLILINGLLALAELAIVSSRRARLRALVDREVIGSRRALALASDPGRFLSTVQIGITLVGVLSGAFLEPRSGCVLQNGLPTWACPRVLPRRSALAWSLPLLLTFP